MSILTTYIYNAEVIRVVDGDTVIARVDVGFDMWKKCNIRLHGIDTPETRTRDLNEKKAGNEAKSRLIELLKANDNKFILDSKGLDKYGRVLGILFTGHHEILPWEDSKETRPIEISLNDLLVIEGHAVKYNGGSK